MHVGGTSILNGPKRRPRHARYFPLRRATDVGVTFSTLGADGGRPRHAGRLPDHG